MLDMLGRENVFVSVSDAVTFATRQLSERGYGAVLVPAAAPEGLTQRGVRPSGNGMAPTGSAVAESHGMGVAAGRWRAVQRMCSSGRLRACVGAGTGRHSALCRA